MYLWKWGANSKVNICRLFTATYRLLYNIKLVRCPYGRFTFAPIVSSIFSLDIPEKGSLETSIMRSLSRRCDDERFNFSIPLDLATNIRLIIISCKNCDCKIQRTRQRTTAIWHGIREMGRGNRGGGRAQKRRSVEVFCGVREPLWSGLLRQNLGFTPFDRHT